MNKISRKSGRNGKTKGKRAEPSADSSMESSQVVIEPRRSFWKSFSSIFKCTRRRRISADSDEQANILPVQNLPPIMETTHSNVEAACSVREDIDDMKTMLKKYSISPHSISMIQRIDPNDGSKNVSKQSSMTGYVTDVSASSSDEEDSVRKKVLLKNKINEFKHEIIREESTVRADKCEENEKTVKKNEHIACSSSVLTADRDTYSFDYSESSQQSVADGNEEKQEKVMFDNNIKVKDENDIVTVDSINDASQQIKQNIDDEDIEENVNYDALKNEEKVALIEAQYNTALSTMNKIEEQLTVYSQHLESMRSTDDITGQSLEVSELENKDAMQNAMKVFGTKIMDNQGSNLLRHLHDMHQKHPETIQSNALSLEQPEAKTKLMNMQLEYCRKFGYAFPCVPAGHRAGVDDNDEETQDNRTSSSESLKEVEVWSKDLNNRIKYVDRRDLPIFSVFKHCPVNEDGYKMLRLNSLFVAVAHPVTLKYRVVYDPIVNSDEPRQLEHDDESNAVTHKPKHMSLVQHAAMHEEDSQESVDNQSETYYTNEEKWESCTNETGSFTHEDNDVTDDEDSDWKTVDLEEIDVGSVTNTEDSHEEYVNQQNRYNLMSTLSWKNARRVNPPVEFKVTMRNPHKANTVREYIAYRNVKNLVDRSTSYSSLPAADAMEVLYKNQDARSEESTVRTEENNEIKLTFRNINDDVEHMINDLLIDVSEVKDGCMEFTKGMSDEPMVELKRTSNGVIKCIDTSTRISEALAQTIIHEILDDVFYYSEEHVTSEADELLHCQHEIADAEFSNQDKCEDILEGAFTYVRKDDRSKVFRNLDEVMQDLADDTNRDQGQISTDLGSYEYCTCSPNKDMQRVHDEKMTLLQVQSILQRMLEREANKRQKIKDVQQNRLANVETSGYNDNHSAVRKSSGVPKYTNCDTVFNERKELLTDSIRPACNYQRFFNNNFSIKNGFIDTPNNAMFNTCSHSADKDCRADSALESGQFNDTATKTDQLRYAEQQAKNSVYRKSQNIELPPYSRAIKRKNRLMVDRSTGNEEETQPDSSKTNRLLDKNEVEQNIEENLWSFEEAMRNLIRVNRKTAKLLKSSCVFASKPSRADDSVEKPCCSSKCVENTTKCENTSQKRVAKDLTAPDKILTDQSLTQRDESLTKSNQHLSENLAKILSTFSQQFSDCIPEKSNVQ